MKKNNLVKAFTIYSFIAFFITGLLLTFFIRNHLKNESINNVNQTTAMNLELIIKSKISAANFNTPFQTNLRNYFNEKYSYLIKKQEMAYINIWNAKGVLLYSNNNILTDDISSNNENFKFTLNDKITYDISALNNKNSDKYIKIYVPIVYNSKVVGVYEEIKSYKEIEMHLNKVTSIILVTVFTGLVLLYFLLLRIIYTSSKKLVSQNESLIEKSKELELSYEKLNTTYKETIMALSNAVDARDPYTAGHSDRVTKLSLEIGSIIGLSNKQLEILEIAALFHDIGKIGIPDAVLNKPGKLTEDEYNKIKEHPEIGVSILKNINFLEEELSIILHHHERYSGSGYPTNISGQAIPIESRIITVADTYDAMTSDRPYRKGLSSKTSIEEIVSEQGRQFDPSVVMAFLKTQIAQEYFYENSN